MVAAAVAGVTAHADPALVSVPVAARALPAGTILETADLVSAELPVGRLYAGTPRTAEEITGKRLSRAVKAGESFNSLTLKPVSLVERNSLVTVRFVRPGVELTGQALALESGGAGKAIKILNQDSRATLVATVTAPGTVTVGDVP